MMTRNNPPAVSRAVKCLIAVALAVGAGPVFGSTNNLLSNGNFANGLSGWSTFTDGGWVSAEIPGKLSGTTPTTWPAGWPAGAGTNAVGTGPLYDGTLQLTCGKAGGGGSFAWQIVAGAENVEYTLRAQGAAENWWLPSGEIRLFFLDATDGGIATNIVRTTDSIHNAYNGGLGDMYDVGVVYQNWTNTAVSPPGTKKVKVELCNPAGTGSAWFDNAVLTAPINPPLISSMYPNGTRLLQATNVFSFNVTSAASIESGGILVTINGVDVSGSLVVVGSGTTNVNVSYSGLASNKVYTAYVSVTDTVNLNSFTTVNFDTYAPSFLWEAEDYDYNAGQFINSPVLSSTPMVNSYYEVAGMEGIDFHDRSGNGDHVYRSSDAMAIGVTGDTPRQNFVNAGVSDHNVGWFDGAGFPSGNNVGIDSYQSQEWVNYTRTFTPGVYNIYARIASGNGPTATVRVSKVTSGQGTINQTTASLGQFKFVASGWGDYAYVPLTDAFGNLVKVGLTNTETLKVLAGSGANLNFFMILPASFEKPTITSVYPDGATLLQGTNALTFTVSSALHAIAQSNVVVTLNGVTNASKAFSGSSSSWNVSVPLVQKVTNYTAVITVADDAGNSHSTTVYFDTFSPASYSFEAEDFNFDGGQFIDNPVIASSPAPNSYFDKAGQDGVDSFYGDEITPPTADFRYRSADIIATSVCTDTKTRALVAAQTTNSLAFNYNVSWWSTNAWLNYSRTYPSGQFKIYARLAGGSGNNYNIQLDRVSGSPATLGWFVGVGRGYNAFDWIPLINTNNGQPVTVTLDGLATLRTTSLLGNVNPNSYLLVSATPAAESLQASYAGGMLTLSWTDSAFHLQSQTNSPAAGLSTNWVNYPGGASSPVGIPIDQSLGNVFFRLSN